MHILTLPQLVRAADPDLPRFFLDRLETLVSRLETARDANSRRAYSAAAFSVYLDCLDLGLEVEAGRIVERVRRAAA